MDPARWPRRARRVETLVREAVDDGCSKSRASQMRCNFRCNKTVHGALAVDEGCASVVWTEQAVGILLTTVADGRHGCTGDFFWEGYLQPEIVDKILVYFSVFLAMGSRGLWASVISICSALLGDGYLVQSQWNQQSQAYGAVRAVRSHKAGKARRTTSSDDSDRLSRLELEGCRKQRQCQRLGATWTGLPEFRPPCAGTL